MMRVPVEVSKSRIHGYGIFSVTEIKKGEVVWSFSRFFDHAIPQHVLVRGTKEEQTKLLIRGFRNPHNEDSVVMCGDEAQWLNFPPLGQEANVVVGGGMGDGYDILVAACDIPSGEELLVEPASDLDYHVKMLGYAPVTAGENKKE